MSQSQATWPSTSFLFNINTLPVNEDPSEGGVAPRTDEFGRWLPPLYRAGFSPQTLGNLYRWENGIVTQATEYQWLNSAWRSSRGEAVQYRTNTIYYCNPFYHFLACEGDASTLDMAYAGVPYNRWHSLNFYHDHNLSRLELGGDQPYLAGNGRPFIDELGIGPWSNPSLGAPISGGLAGNVALIIALVVFSCTSQRTDHVLRNSWSGYQWRGHSHGNGRREGRGIVVRVYYDPHNTNGSNQQTLTQLEWHMGHLLI